MPTASGDNDGYCLRFYDAFSGRNCVPAHLPLFQRRTADLRAFVLSQDIMKIPEAEILNTRCTMTAIGGDIAYER